MSATAADFGSTGARTDLREAVVAGINRRKWISFAIPVLILVYLGYSAFAFDVAGLLQRARLDNVQILLSDFVSYKTHVTRDNRSASIVVAIEGENKGTYPEGQMPGFVSMDGDVVRIDLGGGHRVTYEGPVATYSYPGYGEIVVSRDGNRVDLSLPGEDLPPFINASRSRVTIKTPRGRMSYTRNKIETFKYDYGWELFFFTLDSPFAGKGPGELIELALWGERIDPDRSNLSYMFSEFWNNRMWRHKDVMWAIFETVLMAFLGTMTAALVALPLAFVAALNFTPSRVARAGARRLFDFFRGVDGLIWTIILSRAFGPGPLTGAIAIAITDTGSFGKMFSEALENVDHKQIEGVQSTGANVLQRARFAVLPQVVPVFLSQVLYYFESNTRSATVIGAIVGGGIGLLLTQAISTQKDWEEVSYYIVLIILMVMAMDSASGWIRAKLIGRSS
ncbi:phosphonate ABC transporter, permease protein PhnE [Oricola thermophila]|uniref:Phosphonate ABC transporter, permease protein PhnE n=1 Tax=Oricola thermophila TaxID=2742145 RepID=A0A6N1V9Y9_9HYPH|nr:phosphonate ABC transporter, permease protein PhnE [Oricola thermophila]QKV17538.1 phosphonate ABC transporter, permease protein PhnE [Oricola thermophila]